MINEDLGYYYEHLYPFHLIYDWLTYRDTFLFNHRELSFQYENGVVQRYVTFGSPQEMKSRMVTVGNVPRKVDAGAIWTGTPAKDNKQHRPLQRQFIFDFDMDDYDDVRTCCQGKKTCVKCWKLLIVAIEVLKVSLREDFGFNNFLFVFSGGRGIHIWICDEKARIMGDSLRKAIVDYLEVVTGNDKAASLLAENVIKPHTEVNKQKDPMNREKIKESLMASMHPHVIRSLQIIRRRFAEVFNEQEPLLEDRCKDIIAKILEARSKKLKERVFARWQKCEQRSMAMYQQICEEVNFYQLCSDAEYPTVEFYKQKKYKRITFIEEEIQLSFLYPRMDYNVSTMQNHLLKLPFSVHPSTKNISVPLLENQVERFQPQSCVKLGQLIEELTELSENFGLKTRDTTNMGQTAKKTKLAEYVRTMEQFCSGLGKKEESS